MFVDTEEWMVAVVRQLLSLPEGRVSAKMPPNPTLPFVLVTRVTATDDKVTELATCDVEVFHNSRDSANDVARQLHSKLIALSPKTGVALTTGTVGIDSVSTILGPAWVDYGDEDLERYVARYEVASRINSQPL